MFTLRDCIYSDLSLRGLYQMLRESITKLRSSQLDKPVCVILDDFSVLLSVGVSVREMVSLIHYCQQLLCTPEGLCQVSYGSCDYHVTIM